MQAEKKKSDEIKRMLINCAKARKTRRKQNACDELELVVGIEPTACSLRVSCSTPEPH